MIRYNVLCGFAIAATLSAAPRTLLADTRVPKRPNIVFLFSDDQRFDTIGALGNPEIKTPNMDKLVHNGLTFTHAHIMGATFEAVCMPSRAMLMSGRTLFHLDGVGQTIPPEHATMPETFRKAGYSTFGIGKWHNGPQAFTRSFANGGKILFGGMFDHWKMPVFDYEPTGKYPQDKIYIGQKFSSELFSDEAIQFIKNHPKDKPFFVYTAYTAPHDPRTPPKEYADMYPPQKMSLPKNFKPEHPFDNGELLVRDEKLAPFPRTPEAIREHIAAYYAMITHLDAQIGRVLQAVEDSGQADNTIIVFASDNGLAVGRHGLMGKQNLYEHSVRVPLIFCGPGLPKGKKSDALCYLLDIYPTLCELAGLPIPKSVEGKSLAPLCKDEKAKVRDEVFYAYKNLQRGVRTDRWKLIMYNVEGRKTTQLFDLQNDPWELNNLAHDPAQADRLKELTARLRTCMKDTNDFCDLDKPVWDWPTQFHFQKNKKK